MIFQTYKKCKENWEMLNSKLFTLVQDNLTFLSKYNNKYFILFFNYVVI